MTVLEDELVIEIGDPILINAILSAGPPPEGSDAYVHDQATPASEWIINHGFGRPTNVAVWIGDEEVTADLQMVNLNTVRVEFPTPQSGKAVVS